MGKEQQHRVPDAWSVPTDSGHVTAPLAIKVQDSYKHLVAHGIRTYYHEKMGISFTAAQTHFFDDRADNIKEFEKCGYNAYQVSCKSRDSTMKDEIGWCGGTVSECRSGKGVHLCGKEDGSSVAEAVVV